MSRALSLAVFPALGLALLLLAWIWSAREVRLLARGTAIEGRIAGMVLDREGGSDLITGIESLLVFQRANGERLTAISKDGVLTSVKTLAPGGTEAAVALDALDSILGEAELGVLEDARTGNAESIRWALMREARSSGTGRQIVRIERTDTVDGYFGLGEVPRVLTVRAGRPFMEEQMPGRAVVRAVFDQAAIAGNGGQQGEALIDYSFTLDGREMMPKKRDFLLAAEPYTTQFLPVFIYGAEGSQVARISHVGRQGGPTLALRLHRPCRVYFDARDPTDAVLMADVGPAERDNLLGWFSRYCEGLFAQWGSTALMVLAGLSCLLTGLMLISLAVWPGRTGAPSHEGGE